ncbi:proline racemase (plasmid) [Pseudonocardia sp. EC080610-09]|uniref:proline racemase family protein n=1 Tax=unclassified Pseudonocardia TaxID=2619320 RepID=UPI000705A00C|nr:MULTISPECIES: proline racemase family protein [unclassified Pseudonocardia]ALL79465.1 proline racemase [Pseudonocardia sp. EC080610-09]ALL85582.1 proline racemase [Pseudonocardia sp. EC080619-01]
MRTGRVLHTVESHAEGLAVRVVTGGVGALPGATMAERRRWFVENSDDLRTLLMCEPRGHGAMSGVILQPSTRPDADWGVLFIEVTGALPMCGAGTIATATVLVETGMVPVTEPVTTVRLDAPVGLVVAEVRVQDGRAEGVTIANVASYAHDIGRQIDVEGVGRIEVDIAYGGNFYAIVDLEALGVPFERKAKQQMLDASLSVMAAINEQARPQHPEQPEISACHHVYLAAPGATAQHSRHALAIHPGWVDRSPGGTGTSARMAQLHARGELELHTDIVNESIIGTSFTGRLVGATDVGGRPAVLPTFTGRAWVTGTAQYMLDPSDPFPAGFEL